MLTKDLKWSNRVTEDEDRASDKKDILHRIHQLSSLRFWMDGQTLKTPARVNTNPLPALTRNTAATFRRKATVALLKRIAAPSLGNS